MSGIPRRGMNSAHSRTSSVSRSNLLENLPSDASVLSSTALPRTRSYSVAERGSADSSSVAFKNSKQPLSQSTSHDPFVSISRAINNVKVRAGARLSALATKQRYARSSARYRHAYATAKIVTKVVFVLLLLILAASVLFDNAADGVLHGRRRFFSWAKGLNWWPGGWSAASNIASVSMREALRHRPHAMTTKNFETGPWVIAVVADLDKESCRLQTNSNSPMQEVPCGKANTWVSYLKRGVLTMTKVRASDRFHSKAVPQFDVSWLDEIELSGHGHFEIGREQFGGSGGRGMELSELEWFFGHLLTPDDHTGMLLEVMSARGSLDMHADKYFYGESSNVKPSTFHRATLLDGAGDDKEALFKSEWMVVKDGRLYIGGHGRSYTDPADGTLIKSDNPKWVKVVDEEFNVSHENWSSRYDSIAEAAGAVFPAYVMHEAVLWSTERREWIFLPRRRSTEPFESERNERMGWHTAVIASEDFEAISTVTLEGLRDSSGLRGFSTAKFLPGTKETIIVAIRTIEKDSSTSSPTGRETASFLSIFELATGKILLAEEEFDSKKFEGLVFL